MTHSNCPRPSFCHLPFSVICGTFVLGTLFVFFGLSDIVVIQEGFVTETSVQCVANFTGLDLPSTTTTIGTVCPTPTGGSTAFDACNGALSTIGSYNITPSYIPILLLDMDINSPTYTVGSVLLQATKLVALNNNSVVYPQLHLRYASLSTLANNDARLAEITTDLSDLSGSFTLAGSGTELQVVVWAFGTPGSFNPCDAEGSLVPNSGEPDLATRVKALSGLSVALLLPNVTTSPGTSTCGFSDTNTFYGTFINSTEADECLAQFTTEFYGSTYYSTIDNNSPFSRPTNYVSGLGSAYGVSGLTSRPGVGVVPTASTLTPNDLGNVSLCLGADSLPGAFGAAGFAVVECNTLSDSGTAQNCRLLIEASSQPAGLTNPVNVFVTVSLDFSESEAHIGDQVAYSLQGISGLGISRVVFDLDNLLDSNTANFGLLRIALGNVSALYRTSNTSDSFPACVRVDPLACQTGGSLGASGNDTVASIAGNYSKLICDPFFFSVSPIAAGTCGFNSSQVSMSIYTPLGLDRDIATTSDCVTLRSSVGLYSVVLQSSGVPTLQPEFSYGSLGGLYQCTSFPGGCTADELFCLLDSSGAGATFSIVPCGELTSEDDVNTCLEILMSIVINTNTTVATSLPQATVEVASSVDFLISSQWLATILGSGMTSRVYLYVLFGFNETNGDSNVAHYLSIFDTVADHFSLTSGNPLPLGVRLEAAPGSESDSAFVVCKDPGNVSVQGSLYIPGSGNDMYSQLTTALGSDATFVALAPDSLGVLATGASDQCGFTNDKIAFVSPIVPSFSGICEIAVPNIEDVYVKFSFDPSVAPTELYDGALIPNRIVVIPASIISAAVNQSDPTPTLDNLIKCPTLSIADGGIINPASATVLLDCGELTNQTLLTTCNAVLTAVAGVVSDSAPILPPIAMVSVELESWTYSLGVFASYLGQVSLDSVSGLGLRVTLITPSESTRDETVQSNSFAFGALASGLRGVLTIPGNITLPLWVFPVDVDGGNPCASGGSLYNSSGTADLLGEFGSLADFQPYLIVNTTVTSDIPLCQFTDDLLFKQGVVPLWFTNSAGACNSKNFPEGAVPKTYYPSTFVPLNDLLFAPTTLLTGTGVVSNIELYPVLASAGVEYPSTDLAGVVGCVNSTTSAGAVFGSVAAFGVHCGSFGGALTSLFQVKVCSSALSRLRGVLGYDVPLFLYAHLQILASDPTHASSQEQAFFIASSMGNLGVNGLFLYINETAPVTVAPEVTTMNLEALENFTIGISSYFGLSEPNGTFSTSYVVNPVECLDGGALGPVGSGSSLRDVGTICNDLDTLSCHLIVSDFRAPLSGTCGFSGTDIRSGGWRSFYEVWVGATSGGTSPVSCTSDSVVAATHGDVVTVTFPKLNSSVFGSPFKSGSVGPLVAPSDVVNASGFVSCLVASGGVNASFGALECTSSDSGLGSCRSGIVALRGGRSDLPIVTVFSRSASGELETAGSVAGDFTNSVGGAGVFVNLSFNEPGPNVTANIDTFVQYARGFSGRVDRSTGTNLTFGVILNNLDACVGSSSQGPSGDSGYLYESDNNQTLYAKLRGAVGDNISVLLFVDTVTVSTGSASCGFPVTRVGYGLVVYRDFSSVEECVSVGDTFIVYTYSIHPSVAPGTGGGSALTPSPSPYWAFFALPCAALLLCLVSTGTVCVLYQRRRTHYATLEVPDFTPGVPGEDRRTDYSALPTFNPHSSVEIL